MAVSLAEKRIFSERVRHFREKLELTRADLGKRAGVSGTCVWNWEEANTFPRPATLRRLATALRTTVSHLNGVESASSGGIPEAQSERLLSEVIMDARAMVANAAGVPVSAVRIILDCGD